ncbi:MAG: DUF4846 domain-containing protein [Cytophagaceae bacterium]
MQKFKKILSISGLFILIFSCSDMVRSEKKSFSDSRSGKNFQEDTSRNNKYSWLSAYDYRQNLINRIPCPAGFERIASTKNSFADWLRHLPLKKAGAEVNEYNGTPKNRQDVHEAVINIDAGGNEDLQQCADAVMRLKAEYHYSRKQDDKIHFKYTSGDIASWTQWKQGYRPQIKGNKVSFVKTKGADGSYENFKKYLISVFRYAGTASLSKEMKAIPLSEIEPGDVFIKGGFPGHAVIVTDVAVNKSGEKVFMIAQSYMPAQDIHILKNFEEESLSPWYSINFGDELETPEWDFSKDQLKRFQ